MNLERVGKSDLSKVSSLMRKQTKRYQALSGKLDDLCQRMVLFVAFLPFLSDEFYQFVWTMIWKECESYCAICLSMYCL